MPDKLAILIASIPASGLELCATPLVHALAARALDAEVEIHFAGPSVRLLVSGVAEGFYASPARDKSLREFLTEVIAADVGLLACSMAQEAWVGPGETLIDAAGHAGATAFVARTLDPAWRTLVY